MAHIVVVEASPRLHGNSHALAEAFTKGARAAGHNVETIRLARYTLNYCKGCYGTGSPKSCDKTGTCWQHDDANALCDTLRDADIVAFALPIYFYSVPGQLKTFFDRSIQLRDTHKFKDIYLLATSESGKDSAMDGAISDLDGWIRCMPDTRLAGVVRGTSTLAPGDITDRNPKAVAEAEAMGKNA